MADILSPKTPPRSSKFFRSDERESTGPVVIDPDHALMERFQAALKKHLLGEKDKLEEQLKGLDIDLKKSEKEEEDLGSKLFSIKQDLATQKSILEARQRTLDGLNVEKTDLDSTLKELRESVNEQRKHLDLEVKKEFDLRLELDDLRAWEQQINKWKDEMGQELAVNQRISEKTQVDRKRRLEEKRKLDMFIFRLGSEVSKLESELALLNSELDGKEKEKDLLNQSLSDANTDLQALAEDQKRLLNDWNTIVVALSKRDAAYEEVIKELEESQEAFRNLNAQIESYKKSSEREIARGEELAFRLSGSRRHSEQHNRRLKTLLERKMDLEHRLAERTDLNSQAERDLKIAEAQMHAKENELQNLQKELDDLIIEKRRLEDESLKYLLEQTANDKAAVRANKDVQVLRQKAREAEVGMAEYENKVAKATLEVEKLKGDAARNEDILQEMNRDLDVKQIELDRLNSDTREIQTLLSNRAGSTVIIMRKIEELAAVRSNTGCVLETPLQTQARELNWQIEDLKKKNSELQSEWLIQQNSVVKLTQKRSEILRDISMLRKQIVLLEQKQQKTVEEVEREEHIEVELIRTINNMQHRLTTLSATLADKSGQRENVDKDLLLAQVDFVKSLKESERDQLKAKTEIHELEQYLEDLNILMLETQREMLAWEKKITLVVETKLELQREKTASGDIGQMRNEIHCMEVRLTQLKRVQDKLVSDMEQCVHRRGAIIVAAEARERKGRGVINSRANFRRKLDELKRKIKQARQELKTIDIVISQSEATHQQQLNELNEKTEQLRKLQETSKEMETQLENGLLRKQQNLEILVRRQRRCKLYGLIKAGKYRPLYRNDLALENELGIARTTNANLSSILEALVADFPGHKVPFTRILNSLKLDLV